MAELLSSTCSHLCEGQISCAYARSLLALAPLITRIFQGLQYISSAR